MSDLRTKGDRRVGVRPRATLMVVMVGAGLSSSACLRPAGPETPAAPMPQRSVAACRPEAGGPARLVLRRGYLEDPVFRPLETRITLDGRLVFSATDEERLRTETEVVLDAPIAPGQHELTSVHRLRGHGNGTHSYLRGYRFTVPSKQSFEVRATGGTCITLVLYFREDDGLPLEERPAVRHDEVWGGPVTVTSTENVATLAN